MADGKGAARARRSGPAQIIGSQRTHNMGWQANKVNVALPFSMIRAEEPATMRVGDWISLAGLVVSVVGFGRFACWRVFFTRRWGPGLQNIGPGCHGSRTSGSVQAADHPFFRPIPPRGDWP